MTEAEKIYERFVNYEWNEVSDSLKESILKAINEALKQGQTYPLGDVSLDEQSETTVCDNPHCINGTVEVIYGEPIRCSICDEQTGN